MKSRLPFRRMRHFLELPLAKLIVSIASVLPRKLIWITAGLLGFLASLIPGKSSRIFRINRRHIMKPCGLNVHLSTVYRNLIAGMLDFFHLSERSDDEFTKAVEVHGAWNMEVALSSGKGAIAITAHYSAWELIPRAIKLMGHRVGVVSRKLAHGDTSEYFDCLRKKHDVALVDRSSSIVKLMHVLRENTAVGILIDQDTMGVESEFVDFLGLPARTPVGPAQLAIRFGIPVLTLHIARKGNGRYILTIDEPMVLSDYSGDNGYLELTADLTGRIEEWIREDPQQWIWIHERWARRPGWASGLR
ncbi:MAG: lysophospholipid acyltransferase family protein [Candidatus Aegiribacteria sp.]|nr:lysophospholipid acyltransferase family protein [Candidatus Aegiribacteria sp.]